MKRLHDNNDFDWLKDYECSDDEICKNKKFKPNNHGTDNNNNPLDK